MADITEFNRKHWDSAANTYDSEPWQQQILAQIATEIQSRLDWIGVDWVKKDHGSEGAEDAAAAAIASDERDRQEKKSVRVLDYACGPGSMTRVLSPYATYFRGIDISANMVQAYNARATAQGYSPAQMSATVGDLLAPQDAASCSTISGPEFHDFDVAAVGLGFHHFVDPTLATKQLVQRLKPGKGVVLIIDFELHEHEHGHGHGHGHERVRDAKHTVAHHGFVREEIEGMLRDAGCVDVEYVVWEEPLRFGGGGLEGQEKTVFMVRGRRGA